MTKRFRPNSAPLRRALASALLLAAGSACAADLYVDASAAGGGDGSQAAPFATIREAVDAANLLSGASTIHVAPGTYAIASASDFATVSVPDLTIAAADPSDKPVVALDPDLSLAQNNPVVFAVPVGSDRLTVANLTFTFSFAGDKNAAGNSLGQSGKLFSFAANGGWRVTEFLPTVPWAGADNTIVCAAGHHFREGRWIRNPEYLAGNARFWLSSPAAEHRWKYCSWLFTGVHQFAEAHGLDDLPLELLDDAVRYYRRWEKGFDGISLWPAPGTGRMGGDGAGGFLSVDNFEGTEISLGGSGWKPLMNAAMWSEAAGIATVARRSGRDALAAEFEAKAEGVRRALLEKCWNPETGFFSMRGYDGTLRPVRELHGYAPWYFGVPVGVAPDWSQLADPEGFAATYGLTFPERRAPGFALSYEGHHCQWNGPSWPFATSVALTALANDLHRNPSDEGRRAFGFLLWQYAAQHRRTRDREDGWNVLPWIDENLNPDRPDWIARTMIKREGGIRERGKDYNHSTFCDLVVTGLCGFVPDGDGGFRVDPLADPAWDWFVLENLRWRGRDISIRYLRGDGLSVSVDGRRLPPRSGVFRAEA